MGWERRASGGLYYCRTIRIGDRLVRRYAGAGAAARLVADADAVADAQRRQQLEQEREQRREFQDITTELDQYLVESRTLIRATLMVAGFHQHDRGVWRRRHGNSKEA
jgi:hypothetical protein